MTALFTRIKTFYTANLLRGRLLLGITILLSLFLLLRVLLTPVISYTATSWLKKQNIEATIESIEISFFNGTVSLHNAVGKKDDKPLFNIGLIDIHWLWTPLSEKTIEVTEVDVDGFQADIQKYTDRIIISGVTIPLAKNEVAAEAIAEEIEEQEPWAAAIGEVNFNDLNICYSQHNASFEQASDDNVFVDYCLSLEQMAWGGSISYGTDKEIVKTDPIPVASSGDFSLSGLTLTDNKLDKTFLSSGDNEIDNLTVKGLNDIHIDKIAMQELSALQRDDADHKDAVRFSSFIIDDIDFKNLNTLSIQSINMEQPGLYIVKQSDKNWEYEQWLPATKTTEDADKKAVKKKAEIKKDEKSSAFSVAINNITIDASDFCYLEAESNLYYCFTLDKFDWQGAINYSTAHPELKGLIKGGELNLTAALIRNDNINKDLLKFDNLKLTEIDIKSDSDIAFNKLTVKELSALQRGEKDNTVTFDQLTVDDLKYDKKSLAIDTVALSGLTNKVSKNKDGSWEHDKWLPKQKGADKEQTKSDKSAAKKTNNDNLIVSLNKLTINSDGGIGFTDNSTSPALEVGLQSLKLEAAKLDASKPDSDSPIKLYAKTIRHSTIDVKGTARPFANKISFKFDGDLKGFDLRAASPAAKKAIGHIIKSGQLDAKLDLKAVEGELDSNVALSLYKFNIKPMSNADAKKLDKEFGMPLNQTLVLLRDKDGSIHLDIPITGDLENPNFNPMDAIIKATSKAATVTLITFYTPYGLIYAGGSVLLDLSTALNFDPINFDPGSANLLDNNKEQLDNLAKLMTEKPQIHLTLCGVTNQSDTLALYPDTKKDKETGSIKLSAEQSAALAQLARDRQDTTKNYLIEEGKITHDRLIVCEPEHSTDEDAIAGVEINI